MFGNGLEMSDLKETLRLISIACSETNHKDVRELISNFLTNPETSLFLIDHGCAFCREIFLNLHDYNDSFLFFCLENQPTYFATMDASKSAAQKLLKLIEEDLEQLRKKSLKRKQFPVTIILEKGNINLLKPVLALDYTQLDLKSSSGRTFVHDVVILKNFNAFLHLIELDRRNIWKLDVKEQEICKIGIFVIAKFMNEIIKHCFDDENFFRKALMTFYGPKVNSKSEKIDQILEMFDQDQSWIVCLFLHDILTRNMDSKDNFLMRNEFSCASNKALKALSREAFDIDAKFETFLWILDQYKRVGCFQDNFLASFLIPPQSDAIVLLKLYKTLSKMRESLALDMNEVFRGAALAGAEKSLLSVLFSFTCNTKKILLGIPKADQKCFLPKGARTDQVFPLKHLCRLEIRDTLEKKSGNQLNEFLKMIKSLELSEKLKNYLLFLDEIL